MKLNKTFGRVATTLVATAMLASLAAVPTFAAADDVIQASSNSITIKKAVDMTNAEKAGVPDATFTFTVNEGAAATGIKAGDLSAITNNDADGVTAGKQVKVSTESTKTSMDITLNFDPTQFADTGAGVYRYTFEEDSVNAVGMSVDDKTYNLDVTVVNSGNSYAIQYAELYQADGDKSATKTDTITDSYATYDLELEKQISGLLGDKTKSFDFTVTFTNPDQSATSFTKVFNGSETPVNFGADGTVEVTVQLKHGEKVYFKGLPQDVSYVITEQEGTDYIAAAAGTGVDENIADSTYKVDDTDKKVVNGDVETTDNTYTDVKVTYTNTHKNDDTPATGIVMDVAPYALLVVAAAAGCFVFLRKRRED